jgi:hypothetical protein
MMVVPADVIAVTIRHSAMNVVPVVSAMLNTDERVSRKV